MNSKLIERANRMFREFNERLQDRKNTVAQFVLYLTLSAAIAPLGGPYSASRLQLAIGILCFFVILMVFLGVYCRLKEFRVLKGRIRASTALLITMPTIVCATVLWIHYDEWFGPTAR